MEHKIKTTTYGSETMTIHGTGIKCGRIKPVIAIPIIPLSKLDI
jgi:hypothetical protein